MLKYSKTQINGIEEVSKGYKEPYLRIIICSRIKETRCGNFLNDNEYEELAEKIKKTQYYKDGYLRLVRTQTCLGICPRENKKEFVMWISLTNRIFNEIDKLSIPKDLEPNHYVIEKDLANNIIDLISDKCDSITRILIEHKIIDK